MSVGFYKALRLASRLIPGDFLKTAIYLNLLAKPRKFLRKSVGGFYRMEFTYEVLREFAHFYGGRFSILEFGVADGYAFVKNLYATHYLGIADRVMVHGFDTFEGMPKAERAGDQSLVLGAEIQEGYFPGRYEELKDYCGRRSRNFKLHKGLFAETITEDFLSSLDEYLPILIWIDCDYYSSTKAVFEKLIPRIPTGCVVYFDDIYYNFGSRFTGEMRVIHEINQGMFGENLELVPDVELQLDSNRVYRFINLNGRNRYRWIQPVVPSDIVHSRSNGSPFA